MLNKVYRFLPKEFSALKYLVCLSVFVWIQDIAVANQDFPIVDLSDNSLIQSFNNDSLPLVSVSLLDSNIAWEGVLQQEFTDSGLYSYRFLKEYATTNVPHYVRNYRAASTTNVKFSMKTTSPIIEIILREDTTYIAPREKHSIVIFKNDKFYDTCNLFHFQIKDSTQSKWSFLFPVLSQIVLEGVKIGEGYELVATEQPKKAVYVAIGNSITMGEQLSNNRSDLNYPFLIADSLEYELYNWGIGGSKVYQKVISNFKDSLEPKLITVLWGYNDVFGIESESFLDTSTFPRFNILLDSLCLMFPDSRIVVLMPTFTHSVSLTNSLEKLRFGMIEIVLNMQSKYGNLSILDASLYTNENSLLDEVHLNELGHLQLANAIIGVLNNEVVTSFDLKNINNAVFPNPVIDTLYLRNKSGYIVKDLNGRTLLKGDDTTIDFSDLSEGIYFVFVYGGVIKIMK